MGRGLRHKAFRNALCSTLPSRALVRAPKEEFKWVVETGKIGGGKTKSVGIVLDEIGDLGTMLGNSAPLFGQDVGDGNSEAFGYRLDLRIGRKCGAPDGIFVEFYAWRSPRYLADQPVARLVVAMRIVAPSNKYGFGPDRSRAGADAFNGLLRRWSFRWNKPIRQAQESDIARIETEFLYGPLRLRLP